MIEKKFELYARARIQAVSRERCTFFNFEISVFFKFGRNFDAQILKTSKYIEN